METSEKIVALKDRKLQCKKKFQDMKPVLVVQWEVKTREEHTPLASA
jgi:hypothetical protein